MDTKKFAQIWSENAFMVAVLSPMIVGMATSLLNKLVDTTYNAFRRRFTVTMEVSGPVANNNYINYWLLKWIMENSEINMQHVSVSADVYGDDDDDDEKDVGMRIQPLLAVGTHYIKFQNLWVKVERNRPANMKINSESWETITLTAFTRNRRILFDMIKMAKLMAKKQAEDKTVFYLADFKDCYWSQLGHSKYRRPLKSVVLADDVAEKIKCDILEFIDSGEWYVNLGIPHRRGYLLYGPPGCGKSSLIKALAGEIEYDICILSLSAKELTDDTLIRLMNTTPNKCIVLLEDVDAAFPSRNDPANSNKTAFEGQSKLTFSGLLNAIDGIASAEGRILFMTTNHVDRLDPALIRPGRIDVRQMIDYPTLEQIELIFTQFYPSSTPEMAKEFAQSAKSIKPDLSMAQVQNLFLIYKNNAQQALENINSLLELPTNKRNRIRPNNSRLLK